MAQGPLGPPKLNLVALFQFWRFATGPTLSNRGLFFKELCLARMMRNVTKVDQHGSGSPRSPKTALGSKRSILAICDRSGPVKKRAFFQSCSAYTEC